MDVHQNAGLTPRGREQLVRRLLYEGETPRADTRALGVCEKTVRKWVVRYREEGAAGHWAHSWRCRSPHHRHPPLTPTAPCAPGHRTPRPSAWHTHAPGRVLRRHGRERGCARPDRQRRTSRPHAASAPAPAAAVGSRASVQDRPREARPRATRRRLLASAPATRD